MRPRSRFFAGIFALLATTGALAEGVIASACAPGMEMNAVAMPLDEGATHGADCMVDMAEPGERSDLPEDGRHCPFAPVAAQGCLAIASLAASGVTVADPCSQAEAGFVLDDQQHDLLIETALFHPPRH